jgi:hypothetical protein
MATQMTEVSLSSPSSVIIFDFCPLLFNMWWFRKDYYRFNSHSSFSSPEERSFWLIWLTSAYVCVSGAMMIRGSVLCAFLLGNTQFGNIHISCLYTYDPCLTHTHCQDYYHSRRVNIKSGSNHDSVICNKQLSY